MPKEQQNPHFFYSLTDLGIAHPVAVQIFAGMRAARHDKERQDIDGVHEILCTGGGRERAVKGGRRPFALVFFFGALGRFVLDGKGRRLAEKDRGPSLAMSAQAQIAFQAQKRRNVDAADARPPSKRIARKKTAELEHANGALGGTRRRLDLWGDDASLPAPPSADDGMLTERRVREGAGNTLLALRQSMPETECDKWQVQATSFELHSPKHVRREVRY